MLDHGVLNVPLAKRGNIDAQIDRWKADQAREKRAVAKAAAAQRKVDRVKARALLDAVSEKRMAELALRCNMPAPALRRHLRSQCFYWPAFVIRTLSSEAA